MNQPASPRKRFRPLPKNPDGTVNKDKLKQQFLDARAMSLAQFAEELGYNPTMLYHHIPYRPWREQKIAKLVNETSETVEVRAIDIRKDLISEQLDVIQKTPKTLMGLLNLVNYMIQGQQEDAASDIRDKLSGKAQSEGWKPKFELKPQDVAALANAADKVNNALHKALFLHTDAPSPAHILIQNVKTIADTAQTGSQTDAKQYEVIGVRVQSPEDMARLMAEFYDRPQPPQMPETVVEAQIHTEDQDESEE